MATVPNALHGKGSIEKGDSQRRARDSVLICEYVKYLLVTHAYYA